MQGLLQSIMGKRRMERYLARVHKLAKRTANEENQFGGEAGNKSYCAERPLNNSW